MWNPFTRMMRKFGKRNKPKFEIGPILEVNAGRAANFVSDPRQFQHIRQQEYAYLIRNEPFFGRFASATNRAAADQMAGVLWHANVTEDTGNAEIPRLTRETWRRFIDTAIKPKFEVDIRRIYQNRLKMFELENLARQGNLSRQLLQIPNQSAVVREAPRPNGHDENVELAARWIADHSGTLGEAVPQGLREAIRRLGDPYGPWDLLEDATFMELFENAGTKQFDMRPPDLASFYGGTVIGEVLRDEIVDSAVNLLLRAQAANDPTQWLDLALFMLISNIVAHSLPDGNGRTWRALYACIVLKYYVDDRHPFIAPTYAWLVNIAPPGTSWINTEVADLNRIHNFALQARA